MRRKVLSQNKIDKTFKEGYEEFLTYCEIRNLRPATLKFYYNSIVLVWGKFFNENNLISTISSKTVDEYILFLRTKMNENSVTVNTNLRAIKAVLNYFMKLGYLYNFKITPPKIDKDVIPTYTDHEIEILLKKPNLKKASFIHYECWVICNFLLASGCRRSTLIMQKSR